MNHTQLFHDRILQLRKDEADARIVVIGYSLGANSARTLANQLKDDGARIDLLVYLGGDTVKDNDTSRPTNVGRIVNITGHGSILLGYDLFVKGDEIKGASNHRLDARHFLLPTRAEATELLVQSVAEMEGGRPEPEDSAVLQAGHHFEGR
jgi:pimeloyl-ACP methyl ester carboxylesterase